MTRDDVMRETLQHVRRVGNLMLDVIGKLQRAAMQHDDSKFGPEEFDTFATETPNLKALTYGSPSYEEARIRLGPALKHHYSNNAHHPEHHLHGIEDMDLLQLIEMLADWKAATERHADGNLCKSIIGNAKRFNYDRRRNETGFFGYTRQFGMLLGQTAFNMGWITDAEMETIQKWGEETVA